MKSLRAALVTAVAGTALVAVPATTANAAPPTSAIEVSSTTLHPGDTLTVTQTVYNTASFTITGAKGGLYAQGLPLTDFVDLVSCTGAIICYPFDGHYRADFGDLPGGESRMAVFTFKVRDDAPGSYTLRHQLVGDNYSFDALTGPVITIVPNSADVGVSLNAVAQGLLRSRITYTITVTNNGPADATGIRVTTAYPAGMSYAGSSNCARVGTTRTVNCDVASLASGASTTRSFSADAGLLTLGSFTATAQRTASSPSDPNAANDAASRSCTALTSLLVRC
ncbi:DUF11 domain-containing protein [Kribbella antiqua]|uniref:DUF11 domain-containing protein n=1 Tax=Kribbella antiqua TaxID=2512217 RepID=UPI0018EE6692|nr:DUF11 domain-containing protein [Kribbella antiqua]